MKTPSPNLLGAIIRDYFMDHLPGVRGASPHTIHSYRDAQPARQLLIKRRILEEFKPDEY